MPKWLVKSLLIFVVFVPAAALFPLAAVALTRTPEGAETWFWIAPWSCCFWTLVYSQWSSIRVWQKAGRLKQWRDDHGGFLRTNARACGWMFGSLFFSYVSEFLLLFLARAAARPWLPLATYSPLAFCWLWRRVHA